MSIDLMNELIKLGKEKYSQQTGFIHLNHLKDADEKLVVPILENVTFALALFRSKDVDNIERGLDILLKCLNFQNKDGGFPRYIHEYPSVYLYSNNIDILNAFYWIYKESKKIIPQTILESLVTSIDRLISFCSQKKNLLQPSYAFRFDLLSHAFKEKGYELKKIDLLNFSSKEGLKNLFLSLQILSFGELDKKIKALWQWGIDFYSKNLSSYVGPLESVFQNGFFSEKHFTDLFFLIINKDYKNMKFDDPVFFLMPLIRPFLDLDDFLITQEKTYLFSNEKHNWKVLKGDNFAITSVEKASFIPRCLNGFHFFQVVFGNGLDSNSLVCQHFDGEFQSNIVDGEAHFDFKLNEEIKEDDFEIQFFVENRDMTILVNGRKATSFNMGDEISFVKEGATLKLAFEPLDKTVVFKGHILRGNRPSQISGKKDKFKAYDYLIGLRTVIRPENCTVRAKIKSYAG